MDASASTCNGSNANCTSYDWNWGDGTANGTGVTATHTYATAGTKTITLTVTGTGASPGSASVNIAVYAPDNPPTPGNTGFAFNLNNWTASFTDSSTDDNGVYQVTVDWGDHTVLTTQAQGTLFTHTYLNPGTYTITQKVYDTIGQTTTTTLVPNAGPFAYFSISGTVTKSDGTTAIGSALVQIKKGGTLIKQVYTAANGTYTTGLVLKPATYTVVVTKSGLCSAPIRPAPHQRLAQMRRSM